MFRSIRFDQGLQVTATPQTQTGLLVAEDVDFTQAGIARIRDGDEALPMVFDTAPPTPTPTTAHALWHRREELCMVDGQGSLLSFNRCTDAWERRGAWTPARLRVRSLFADVTPGVAQVDAQTVGNCTLVVAAGGGSVYFAVISTDGSVIVPPTLLDAVGQDIRCAKADDWVLVVYNAGNTGAPSTTIKVGNWSPDDPASLGTVTIPNAIHAAPQLAFAPLYDLRQRPGTNRVTLLTAELPGTVRVADWDDTLSTFNNALVPLPGAVAIEEVSVWPLAQQVGPNPFQARIAWHDLVAGVATVNSARISTVPAVLDQASANIPLDGMAAVTFTRAIAIGLLPTQAQPFRAIVVSESYFDGLYYRIDAWETFGATMTRVRAQWHANLCSMAWYRTGQVFVATSNEGSDRLVNGIWPEYIVTAQDAITGEVVARGLRQRMYPNFQLEQDPCTPDTEGDVTSFVSPAIDVETLAASAGLSFKYSIYQLEVDFTRRAQAPAQLNDVQHAAHGGYVRAYDGQTCYEHDWHALPDYRSGAGAFGGSLTPGGVYTFAFTWEWTDRLDRLHRSAPTLISLQLIPNTVTKFTASVHSLGYTDRQGVKLVGWRSLDGNADVLYREREVLNDPTVPVIQIEFSRSDVQAQENIPLDQQPVGDVLQHDPTPATDWIAAAQGRLWTRDPERGWLVRYSLPPYEGFAVGWNSLQGIELQPQREATALAEQDGQLMVFTRTGAFVVVGSGPEINGGGTAFSTPTTVPLDIGASNQEGVVQLATGIAYQSDKGPRILARTRSGADLAAQIERLFLQHGQRVVSAAYDPYTSELFLIDDTNLSLIPTDPRRSLRLHIITGRWAADTGRQGLDISVSELGEVVILRLQGQAIRRVTGRRMTPEGDPIECRVRTPWIRVTDAELQPCMDALLVQATGTYLEPHSLRIIQRTNYQETAVQDVFVAVSTAPADYAYRHRLAMEYGAIRAFSSEVRMTTAGPSGSDCAELVAIDVQANPASGEVGPLPPLQEAFTDTVV